MALNPATADGERLSRLPERRVEPADRVRLDAGADDARDQRARGRAAARGTELACPDDTFALSVVCGLFVGLAPALQAARPQLTPALKGAPLDVVARSRVGVLRLTLTQALVIAQIAISLLLLLGAGLFVRTLLNLESIPLGFNAVRLLLFDVNARQAGHAPADIARFYAELQGQLRAVPGVTAVTMSHASLIRAGRSLPLQVNGRPATGARVLSVGPRFFSTMDIPVSRGRAID